MWPKRVGGQLYSIPQLLKENKLEFEDEAIGIICPNLCLEYSRVSCRIFRQS